MQPPLQRCLILFVPFMFSSVSLAQAPLHQRIDQLVSAGRSDYTKFAAVNAPDEEFLRRLSLDLTGIIPSVNETHAFLTDKASDKRFTLIDRLLPSDGLTRHLMTTL